MDVLASVIGVPAATLLRCLELTPVEEIERIQRGGDRAAELLVGLPAKRGDGR